MTWFILPLILSA